MTDLKPCDGKCDGKCEYCYEQLTPVEKIVGAGLDNLDDSPEKKKQRAILRKRYAGDYECPNCYTTFSCSNWQDSKGPECRDLFHCGPHGEDRHCGWTVKINDKSYREHAKYLNPNWREKGE